MISSPLIPAAEAVPLLGQAVFLDARAGPDATSAYRRGHVPGALRVDLETDLSELGDPASGGRHPLPSLDSWLVRVRRWGVTPSTPVIVYDAAGGGMAAARAWWMLRAIGHEPLAVVDGGWDALREQASRRSGRFARESRGSVSERARSLADRRSRVRRTRSQRSELARDRCARPRALPGTVEPLDPVAGHIPGAHNLYWQSQLDGDGVLDSRDALRERYAQILGDVPPERVICYCGSGVTACHLLLAMEACGLSGAQLYVGSWSEWCRQERPRATD